MRRLILGRVATIVPVLLLVSLVDFLLLALVPGDPAVTLAGGASATPQAIAHVRNQLRLDEPLPSQYFHWLGEALHGRLGTSLVTGQSVAHQVAVRFPVTLSLVVAAAVISVAIGVPLGVLSGVRPGGIGDASARTFASVGLAIPSFWLAVILVSVFAVRWNLFPTSGYTPITTSLSGWFERIVLPAFTLGLLVAGTLARQLRGALIDTLETPFIRAAWARGGTRRTVLLRHGLKNSAIPAVTVFGLQLGYLLGGAVVIEQIFSIPGLGTYLLQGITSHDLPIVQGVAIVFVLFQMSMSLLVDISYGYLNPRVRVA